MAAGSALTTVSAFTNNQNASIVVGHDSYVTSPDDSCFTNQTALCTPVGIAFDSGGNLWVADTGNNRILEFPSPFSQFHNAAEVVLGFGPGDYTNNGQNGNCLPANASSLCAPTGIAFDSSGDLWVADTLNNRVLEFKPTHGLSFTSGESASLVLGQPNFNANARNEGGATGTGGANATSLDNPIGLAFDSSGDLWVSDSFNNRVIEYTPTFTTGEAASSTSVIGQASLQFPATTASTACYQNVATLGAGLCNPEGITFNAGNLWVADNGNNRVLEFVSTAGAFTNDEQASNILGQTGSNDDGCNLGASYLCGPTFLAFDSAGNLWVSDGANPNDGPTDGNNRVLMFPPSQQATGDMATIVLGQPGFGSDSCNVVTNTNSTQNGICFPYGVAIDSAGNVWVADHGNDRVLEFSSTSIPTPEFPYGSLLSLAVPIAAIGLYAFFAIKRAKKTMTPVSVSV